MAKTHESNSSPEQDESPLQRFRGWIGRKITPQVATLDPYPHYPPRYLGRGHLPKDPALAAGYQEYFEQRDEAMERVLDDTRSPNDMILDALDAVEGHGADPTGGIAMSRLRAAGATELDLQRLRMGVDPRQAPERTANPNNHS